MTKFVDISDRAETFIGMYNVAVQENLSHVQVEHSKAVSTTIMKNGLGVAWGSHRDTEFLRLHSSVDFTHKGVNFRVINK